MDFSHVKEFRIPEGNVKRIDVDGVTVWIKSRLPSEYQEVEWIQNNGDAYVNTLFKPNQNTKTEIKCRYLESQGTGGGVFGARVSLADTAYTFICGSDASKFAFAYGSSNRSYPAWTSNVDYVLARDKREILIDGVSQGTDDAQSFQSTFNALLFTYNNNGSHATAKKWRVYECKIWDNGTLVRHMIPCYKKADSTVGFYDIVNGTFYGKQGSGSFTKGNDV